MNPYGCTYRPMMMRHKAPSFWFLAQVIVCVSLGLRYTCILANDRPPSDNEEEEAVSIWLIDFRVESGGGPFVRSEKLCT